MGLPATLSSRIAAQAARPTGLFGRLLGRIMAFETSAANREAVDLLAPRDGDVILEVGFGHGRTLREIARRASVQLAGVDHSGTMLRQATAKNRDLVRSGRLDLRRADAAALPFADASFDRVLSVHTLYFWADLEAPLSELARVLAPGGTLVLGYRDRRDISSFDRYPPPTYTFHTREEVERALISAGFCELSTTREESGEVPTCYTAAATRGARDGA